MSVEMIWIALIIAVTVITVLLIFRRQLDNFRFRLNPQGLDTELETRPADYSGSASDNNASGGVVITNPRLRGKGHKVQVTRDNVQIRDAVLVGANHQIVVAEEHHHEVAFFLSEYLTLQEFQLLCIHLQMDFVQLAGSSLEEKASALVTQLGRNGQLSKLTLSLRDIRPELVKRGRG